MILDQFWLTDAQFSKIAPHLPTDTRGKARVDDRRVISGIIQVLKSGGRWVDAPPECEPKKTLYNRYVRWAAKGVWVDLFHALAQADGPPAQVLIDSSAVKAHRSAIGDHEEVWGGRTRRCLGDAISRERLCQVRLLRQAQLAVAVHESFFHGGHDGETE